MNILAVDTAGKTAAVAVLRDDVLLYEAQCNNGLTHSETLLPMIDTALKAAGLTVDDLDVLGVTNGAFTADVEDAPDDSLVENMQSEPETEDETVL